MVPHGPMVDNKCCLKSIFGCLLLFSKSTEFLRTGPTMPPRLSGSMIGGID
jgi:hypothetical protein